MNMEMEKKEQEQKLANMTRKSYEDYNNSSRNKDSRRGNRNDNQSDDNSWKTVTNKNSTSKPNYKYDAQKIANITASAALDQEGISLGRPSSLSNWRFGAGSSFSKQSEKKPAASSQMDSSRSSSVTSSRNASGGKLTPSTSLERPKQNLPPRDDDTNKMSRSGSVQNVQPQPSREGSMQRTAPPSRNASQTAPAPSPSISPLPTEQVRQFSETIFKEYVNNQCIKDTIIDFTERFKAKKDKLTAVEVFVEQVLEKPTHHTRPCGKVVTALLEAKVLTVPILVEAASTFLHLADDLLVDYPKFWDYMANLLSEWPLLHEDCKLLEELKTALQRLPLNQQEGCSVVLSRIEGGIRNNQDRILEYLSQAVDTEEYDTVFKWISENVDDPNNNENLVIALTEAVCKAVLDKKSLSNEDLSFKEKYGRYFKKYIYNKEQLELTCLRTIVSFSKRKEHPQGLLLNMFEGLYDSKALSVDSFMQLRRSQTEDIGVVMMNVKNFYDYLEAPDKQG